MPFDPYNNSVGRQLTIIAGSNPEDEKTAEATANILSKDYGLEGILLIRNKDINSETRKKPKDTWPVEYGNFKDGETKFASGERILKDIIDNRHIVFVKHFYTPLTNKSPNDNVHEVRMLGSMLQRSMLRGVSKPLKFTLASPYLPYVRSHSIEKYELQGHFQGDSLALFVKDIVDAGINEAIGIDPHSDKVWDDLRNRKIIIQHMDPFKDPKRKDFRLYHHLMKGLSPEERTKKLMEQCPFVEYYEKIKSQYDQLSLVDPDSGSYSRVKDFAINTVGLENVISFDKKRAGEGDSQISGIRYYSSLKKEDIKGRTFIIIDDLIASGKTAVDISDLLMGEGASAVLFWATHNAGWDPTRLQNAKNIKEVVMLDTVNNKTADKFNYLPKSGTLLAGAIYKSHMNEVYR